MNARLGREVAAAIRKAKLTSPELARRAGVGESWVKQVRTGRIDKPRPDWLSKIAVELGIEPDKLLAMTDQLGARERLSTVSPPNGDTPTGELAALLIAQTKAISELVSLLRPLVGSAVRDHEARLERIDALLDGLVPPAIRDGAEQNVHQATGE